MNLTYLLRDNYDKQFVDRVYQSPVITFEELRRGLAKDKDEVRIQYNTKDQYKRSAKLLGLMDDFRVRFAFYKKKIYVLNRCVFFYRVALDEQLIVEL